MRQLPSEIVDVFKKLQTEIYYLNAKLQFFFLNTDANANLTVRKTAPKFFHLMYLIIGCDIISTFCKLTDPARSKALKKDNLTLEQLVSLIPENSESERKLKQRLGGQCETISASMSHLRVIRNRIISHLDLPTNLTPQPEMWKDVKIENYRAYLDQIVLIMDEVEMFYTGKDTQYDDLGIKNDIDSLLGYLQAGLVHK